MLAIIVFALLFSLVFATNYLHISVIFRGKGEFFTVLLIFLFSLGFLAPKSSCGWVSLPFCRLKSVQIPFCSLFLCQTFICSFQPCKGRGLMSALPNTITSLAYYKIVHFQTAASDFKPCPPQRSSIFPEVFSFLRFVFIFYVLSANLCCAVGENRVCCVKSVKFLLLQSICGEIKFCC